MLSKVKKEFEEYLYPLTKLIFNAGFRPNHITLFACALGISSAYLISIGKIVEAVALLAISGFFDILDGALAKNHRGVTKLGEFLDSVCDRIVDGIVLVSIGIFFNEWLLASIALILSNLVSYTRAKGEKLINKCEVGVMERSERLLVLLGGLILGVVREALIVLIILSFVTVVQRILYVRKNL